jgi:hypothetical protein
MPRHWCSWLMDQVPYGTPMQGVQFLRFDLTTPQQPDPNVDVASLRDRLEDIRAGLKAGSIDRAELYLRLVERKDLYRAIRAQEGRS